MATPGAIAVYTSGSGVPEDVKDRPWRGVYHHWDGDPSGLGKHLIERVETSNGDVASVVRSLIDEAPWGWSNCVVVKPNVATERSWMARVVSLLTGDADAPESAAVSERYTEDDPGLLVAPNNTDSVAYVYVFDPDQNRLDAFSADGPRIGSVNFSDDGTPDVPALDLIAEELVEEAPLPGDKMNAGDLQKVLGELAEVGSKSATLEWVNASDNEQGGLSIVFRSVTWSDGNLTGIFERSWDLVPASARGEPQRVQNCLHGLVDVLLRHPGWRDVFWIASLDPLVRSGARQRETFVTIFEALARRALGDGESA